MKHLRIILIAIGVLILAASGSVYAQENGDYTIGIVAFRPEFDRVIDTFKDGMTELGYIEGQNVTYIYEGPAEADEELQMEVAQAVIDAQVDLIFAVDEPEAVLVNELTDTIPVVFGMSGDPIGAGLVEDLNVPGGNMTGVAALSGYTGRRLQLLLEVDPTIETVFVPFILGNPTNEMQLAEMEEVAAVEDIELMVAEIGTQEELAEAIATMPDEVGAIFFFAGERMSRYFFPQYMEASLRLQAGMSIPVYSQTRGVLMGYGPSILANAEKAARLVDQILRGADPAEIPVENAEAAMMINLETAQMLGIDVPRRALRLAGTIVRPGDMGEAGGPPGGGPPGSAEEDSADSDDAKSDD